MSRGSFWLRGSFAPALAILFWSLIGGVAYLAVVRHGFPVQVQPLEQARRYAGRGDFRRALPEYATYTTLRPFDSGALREMADVLARDGQLDASADALDAVLRLSPRDARTMVRLGDDRVAQRRYGAAVTLYSEALQVSPADAAVEAKLAKAEAAETPLPRSPP